MREAEAAVEAGTGKIISAFRPLRIKNYRVFWIGWLLSNIGSWMQSVALGWLVLQLTGSAFLLGLVGFSATIPILVLSLLGGVYADMFDRRKVLIRTQAALMALAVLLGVLTTLQVITVWQIILISLLSGVASALSSPAYQAMVLDMVTEEDLMNAIALNSMQFNLSRVIGPMIAGLSLGAIGVAGCFYLNAMSFMAVILGLSRITFPATQRAEGDGSVWRRMAEGMKYAHAHNFILSLLGIVAAGSLFGLPYITLLPIFARDILHGGPTELGALMSAGGVGAVLGGLTLAFLGDFSFKGKLLVTGALLFALSVIGFSLSPYYYLSLGFLFVSGWAMITSVAVINTLLQKLVPSHLRGRVMSMYSLAFLGLMPIGNLFAGVTAQLLGAPWALALGGAVLALIVLVVVFLKPELLTLK